MSALPQLTDVSTLEGRIVAGLRARPQKLLPSELLYDAVGSALFEAITHLGEYGLTRADERVLIAHAVEIAALMPPGTVVVELGSGGGRKTRAVLEAFGNGVEYFPIDVSRTALESCAAALSDIAAVHPIEAEYLDGLRQVPPGKPVLVLFLGSTIGNFPRSRAVQFLQSLFRQLRVGDALLLGTDLVKDERTMVDAYDDIAGVTAAFNRNVLARLNREYGANFDVRSFRHEARWVQQERRIEMHLVAERPMRVAIPALSLEVRFEAGQSILTEYCHKFNLDEVEDMAVVSGFVPCAVWTDEDWPFAESLWLA